MGHIIQTFTKTNRSRQGFLGGVGVLLKKQVLALTIFYSQISHLSRKLPNIKGTPKELYLHFSRFFLSFSLLKCAFTYF